MAANTINGTTGNDLLQGQQLSDTQNDIVGFAGNDTLIAATISDTIQGGKGNDSISFGTGLEINGALAIGGLGDDSFYANGTTLLPSTFQGNSGADLFSFTAATILSSVSVRGGEGGDQITVQTAAAVNYNGFVATLGQGADVFAVGTGATNTNVSIYGGKDNDTLTLGGSYSSSTVGTNEGADTVIAAGTAITLTNSLIGLGKGHDLFTNTAGNGQIISTLGTVVGGLGADTISVASLSAVTNFAFWGDQVANGADGAAGLADVITLSANGNGRAGVYASVFGGAGDDVINVLGTTAGAGTGAALDIYGGAGADSISVSVGAHTLRGGAGNDTLITNFTFTAAGFGTGLAQATNLNGGAGVDRFIIQNGGTGNFVGIAGNSAVNMNQLSGLNFIIGDFTDSGDNIVLQGFGTNGTATFSAINVLNTGVNVAYSGFGTQAEQFSGAFAYNLTAGFRATVIAANSGFTVGAINIYESGGDTIIEQVFGAMTAAVGSTANFGGLLTARNATDSANIVSIVLSGQLGIIDNNTAGFNAVADINATFGIFSTNAAGRNGFTITLT